MPAPAPRRSLAARRSRNLSEFDENVDEKENSLSDSLTGRRQSRLLNNSYNACDEPAQTPRQLVDLYQKTVELATQGKINIKNAFSIPLVERLPQVLSVIALDDKENHNLGPNFVKAGSVIDTSAKIYGFRVDALHTETQKLSGNILHNEEEGSTEGAIKEEGQTEADGENNNAEQADVKKPIRRVKAKATTFILTDLSKITLEHEFEFRPLQPPHMCQWRGGIGADSIYAEMVSSTMYSSSDFPLIDGITNANVQVEEHDIKVNSILDNTLSQMIDLTSLRSVIKTNEGHDHILGSQPLREFVFNEAPSGSFIDTIHESCLAQMDESMNKSCINNDDVDNEDGYNHEELVHAAIEDLNDESSHANEVFKNALTQLSNPDPSSIHSTFGNFQTQQSINSNLPSTNGLFSSSFMTTVSFADHMPSLLNSKEEKSEYSYFDAAKLKLFAGPNIWKFTNLLNANVPTNNNTSTVQQQQAPVTPHKVTSIAREGITGPKRNIRVDLFNQICLDNIMLNYNINGRDKKAVGTSQSSLLLRMREKSSNQMQLARKIRALTDLTNFYNFPDLTIELLESIDRRRARQQQAQDYFDHDDFDHHDALDGRHDDENGPLFEMHYDFVRPVHYEKIEFAKGSSAVNPKILKRQMIEEFTRQKVEQQRTLSLDTSTSSQQSTILSSQTQMQPTVEFSLLCENLADHGYLSLEKDLASAFYCMLINCNENKLYMKNNPHRDDLFIQERPFVDQRDVSALSYSYTSHSNLSIAS